MQTSLADEVSVRASSHYAKFCLFCKKICRRETLFNANDLFDPPKFSQVPPIFKDTVNWLWRSTIFCRTRKSIVPWQIPFNWSSYFVIDTRLNGIMYECLLSERSLSRVLVSCRMTLSTFSSFYGKRPRGSYAGACENDGGVDVCWAAELTSPWSVKAESFPTKPELIID